jgi:hypothetical protein
VLAQADGHDQRHDAVDSARSVRDYASEHRLGVVVLLPADQRPIEAGRGDAQVQPLAT